ncbi:MAG: hypothetical protein HC859_09200 [Bacteroidia bacterium]|nr:hypothetical protein [Bacteroidia bacterium]
MHKFGFKDTYPQAMSNHLKKLLASCFLISVLTANVCLAQEDLARFLNAGKADASLLMQSYLNPVVEGFSYGLNGGWYHTAKAHKTLGFDLGVGIHAVFVPTSKRFFDPSALNLQTVSGFTSTSPNGLAPTVIGADETTTYQLNADINGDGVVDSQDSFEGPPGLDLKKEIGTSAVPMATFQLGVGIYKNTDIKFRLVPEQKVGDSKIKLIGFGIMHDVKQHIPGIKLLPFDLSVLIGYTKISGTAGLSGEFDSGGDTRPQQLSMDMSAWLFQALISKKFSVVTFYGGIGYNAVKTDADVTGTYVIFDDPSGTNDIQFTDPVSMTFKNSSARITAGIRLKFGPIYLNGDYTLQEYSTVSVGLGLSIR